MLVVGIDVGTQGARVLAVSLEGTVVSQARARFPVSTAAAPSAGRHEQHPADWWQAVAACLSRLTADLGAQRSAIQGIAVASTSGTVCVLDHAGHPLRPAIMYDDTRAEREVADVATAGAELATALGYQFNAFFALPKLLWLSRHQPAVCAAARYLAHAGDFLVGCLTSEYGLSDETQALKTGYDLHHACWPAFIERDLGIPQAKLPRVARAGTVIGAVTPSAAAQTGVPTGTPVMAGATDGCAGQFAAGATVPGQWVSILGTTLVLKGVTADLVRDPYGRIYSHRHPDGSWLPGGASNVGGGALGKQFAGMDLAALDQQAATHTPTDLLIYPLTNRGERFPFVRPEASGFLLGAWTSTAHLYAGYLEGVAYTERLGYDVLAALGAPAGGTIATCGGAANSPVWLQIRADLLDRELVLPECPEPAFGAAVLAAAGSTGQRVSEAAQAMVRVRHRVEPQPDRARQYDARYHRFVAACRKRGWLDGLADV
ncbi:MAG: FGGY-family carbohydrate kinase [Ktedonobacterales bacterium]